MFQLALQPDQLASGQRAELARSERIQFEIRNAGASELFDRMSGLEQAVAQHVAAGIRERDFIPR